MCTSPLFRMSIYLFISFILLIKNYSVQICNLLLQF
uniref:Uncharacterized protein n=1 Tax=Setaria italica TaxID=4555 RepID=K3YFJ0_SETIT